MKKFIPALLGLIFLQFSYGSMLSDRNMQDERCPPPTIGTCGFCPGSGCQGGRICCYNGCGYSCMDPVDPTPCSDGLPLVKCFARPCSVSSCPAYPGATCEDNYCGGCNAIFRDSSGDVLSNEQCHATCPSLTPTSHQFDLHCTNENYAHSTCSVLCPEGTETNGIKQTTCLPSGEWSHSLGDSFCAKSCLKRVPIYECLFNPCYFAECPFYPDAVCVHNNCGTCDFDFYRKGVNISYAECFQIKG